MCGTRELSESVESLGKKKPLRLARLGLGVRQRIPLERAYKREFAMTDFVDMIFFHADANPDKPAVVTGEAILSYGMLRYGILSVEEQLEANGLKAGDRVGINIANAIGHVTILCALHRCGIVSVSMDRPQVESLNEGVIDALLTDAPISGTTTRMIPVDESWFKGARGRAPHPTPRATLADEALSRLVFSSGTTGQPKIIGLSRRAVKERLLSYSVRLSKPSWERIVCMPGLSTNYGYSFTITALWLGRAVCFPIGANARQMIMAYQAEILVASTHQISVLVKAQEEQFVRLESLRAVHIGGSIAYAPLLTRIRMLICNHVLCGYGSTEAGTVAYAPVDSIFGIDRAVGIVAPWIEAQTLDAQGQPQEFGVEGEIRLRTPGQGFRVVASSPGRVEDDQAGWFHPGDQGILYRNGLLVITGRINEIINRGGVKVSPDAIEEELKKHPSLEDVAAVGVLDAVGLEQIWVAVVTRGKSDLDVSAVFEFCRETMPEAVPDRIFQVSEIPRNRLGKVPRETLKDQLMALEERHANALR
jgi:acyl-coenzyme A synthetase/AMP-(fatty) acid ligase